MIDRIHLIKDLTVDELQKESDADDYRVERNGHYLGAFIKVGKTYHFRDQHHKTWVCAGINIDTGAETIEDAVLKMSRS